MYIYIRSKHHEIIIDPRYWSWLHCEMLVFSSLVPKLSGQLMCLQGTEYTSCRAVLRL